MGHSTLLLEKLKTIEEKLARLNERLMPIPVASPADITKRVEAFVTEELANVPELLRSHPARSKAYIQDRLAGVRLTATADGTGWEIEGEWNLLPGKVDAVVMVARGGVGCKCIRPTISMDGLVIRKHP